jgi:hypothetical protein
MNYIKEMNAFFDWLETNPSEATTQLLWFHLMGIANKSGWPEWFTVANITLQAKVGISENTLIKHRNYLKQSGRIEYQNLGKKKAGKYRVIQFTPQFTSNNEVIYAAIPAAIHAVNNEVNYSALFKEDFTKLNNLYFIPEDAKDRLRMLLNTCRISGAGIDGLETIYSYLGQVEIEVIEKALKKSEGKPVNWFVKVINGFMQEGKTTAESISVVPKAGDPPKEFKHNKFNKGFSNKPKISIIGDGNKNEPMSEENRYRATLMARHLDGENLNDKELELLYVKLESSGGGDD